MEIEARGSTSLSEAYIESFGGMGIDLVRHEDSFFGIVGRRSLCRDRRSGGAPLFPIPQAPIEELTIATEARFEPAQAKSILITETLGFPHSLNSILYALAKFRGRQRQRTIEETLELDLQFPQIYLQAVEIPLKVLDRSRGGR